MDYLSCSAALKSSMCILEIRRHCAVSVLKIPKRNSPWLGSQRNTDTARLETTLLRNMYFVPHTAWVGWP